MFGEEVSKVDSAQGPIDVESFLFDVIEEPVELHVNGFGLVLSNSRVDDAVGSAVGSLNRGWRLWMTKFCKCGSYWKRVWHSCRVLQHLLRRQRT